MTRGIVLVFKFHILPVSILKKIILAQFLVGLNWKCHMNVEAKVLCELLRYNAWSIRTYISVSLNREIPENLDANIFNHRTWLKFPPVIIMGEI